METQEVINLLGNAVKEAGDYKCVSGVVAQLILEVGWSLKTPKDYKTGKESYNLGNIKGEGPAGSVTIITTEYYSIADLEKALAAGTLISAEPYKDMKLVCKVYAKFKAYHNYAESIKDHYSFLTGDRYQRAGVLNATTPEEYAKALQAAGYATDPNYANKIISIVDRYNLRSWDPTYHIVQDGDTVYRLSREYGSSVDQIKEWNNLTIAYTIHIGQKLRVK